MGWHELRTWVLRFSSSQLWVPSAHAGRSMRLCWCICVQWLTHQAGIAVEAPVTGLAQPQPGVIPLCQMVTVFNALLLMPVLDQEQQGMVVVHPGRPHSAA